jgi:LPPG:FO 2-phospho-L-lactate transferase
MSDQDFAMHLHRTLLLRQGLTLSQATAHVTRALGIGVRILPMTDDPVQTHITTPLGDLPLQEYFVRERAQVKVLSIHFAGVERARPSPGVLEAIHSAQGIIIAPSNPFISIQPILSVPGIRQALKETKAPIVSVSPLVGGRAIKGPADRMMVELGLQPRAPQVAELYRDFLDAFIMDIIDQGLEPEVKALGIRCLCTNTLMKDLEAKAALAEAAMKMLGLRQ